MLVLLFITHREMDKQSLLIKLLVRLLTKLVNEKRKDKDGHLSIIFIHDNLQGKVAIGYTPYKLIYGLHPLMPIEYARLAISGDHKDVEPTRVLIAKITELEKLQENILEAQNHVGGNQWSRFLWGQQQHTNKEFQFGDYVVVSQGRKITSGQI
jgi:hypothetical protein